MAVLRAIVAVLNKPPRWLLMLLVPSVAVVVLCFWLLVFAAVTLPYNPMLLVFLETFDIANESGETIAITPIGATETAHRLRELPSFQEDYPPARDAVSRNIPMAPGQRIKYTYDWDDVNFTHIVIRGPDGVVRALATDYRIEEGCCGPPKRDEYIIPPLSEIPMAPAEMHKFVDEKP